MVQGLAGEPQCALRNEPLKLSLPFPLFSFGFIRFTGNLPQVGVGEPPSPRATITVQKDISIFAESTLETTGPMLWREGKTRDTNLGVI